MANDKGHSIGFRCSLSPRMRRLSHLSIFRWNEGLFREGYALLGAAAVGVLSSRDCPPPVTLGSRDTQMTDPIVPARLSSPSLRARAVVPVRYVCSQRQRLSKGPQPASTVAPRRRCSAIVTTGTASRHSRGVRRRRSVHGQVTTIVSGGSARPSRRCIAAVVSRAVSLEAARATDSIRMGYIGCR